MRVVYTPAHLAHDTSQETFLGFPIPAYEVAERAENIRAALIADAGFADLRADRARPRADHRGARRGSRAVPLGGVGRGQAPGGRSTVPRRRHVPEPGHVRGHERRRVEAWTRTVGGRRTGRLVGTRHGLSDRRRDVWRGEGCGRYGPDDGRSRASMAASVPRTACVARPAITPHGRCTAATASSTTRRSRPSRSSVGPASGWPSSTSTSTTATVASRSSGAAVTCCTPPSMPIRPASTRSTSAGPTRRARATALGRTSTCRWPAGIVRRRVPRDRSTRPSTRSPATPGSIVVVSLGFDTYGLDPDRRLRADDRGLSRVRPAGGRRSVADLVILQEGGYHRPSLGENARAWLRGAEGRPFEPLPAAGFTAGGSVV